eukprot:4038426-Alexandrium_andersonii.AAC.1
MGRNSYTDAGPLAKVSALAPNPALRGRGPSAPTDRPGAGSLHKNRWFLFTGGAAQGQPNVSSRRSWRHSAFADSANS